MKKSLLILIITSLCLCISCKDDEPQTRSYRISGLVQKGPFVIGTTLSIAELSSSLNQTGNTISTEILDNSGSFNVGGINLTSSFVELSASGFYFDEVKGEISTAPLTLKALSDLTDASTVNVNILTHLEKPRVEYLVGEGNTFSDAKETAQTEVLAAFGIETNDLDNSELLDIAFDNQGGAALLAVSVILQGNRSVGDLSELLATISNDLREDGTLDKAALMTSLRSVTKTLNLTAIRNNLEARYNELGSASFIPAFEAFVDEFLQFTGEMPVAITESATYITGLSASLNGMANAGSLATTVSFEYGTTAAYGNSITMPESLTGHTNKSVSTQVALAPATTYHFRLKLENSKGVSFGDDKTFETLGQLPAATTSPATGVMTESVTLNGIIDANDLPTTVTFEYGLNSSYGSSTPASVSPLSGTTSTNVSAVISGLTTGKTYHFRIKAENQLGVTLGLDFTFIPFHAIGTPFEGGVLAYVLQPTDPGYDPNTVHGLIIASSDVQPDPHPTQPHIFLEPRWADFPLPMNATNQAIGSGRSNTDNITSVPGVITAAAKCQNLVLNGYDDWFMPSVDEMKALDMNITVLGLTKDAFYWTSSEQPGFDGYYAWWYRYDSWIGRGEISTREKSNRALVRPMRYF